MALKNYKRNLLKFSLYSTAVVLPKKLLLELGWAVGDEVRIVTDSKSSRLIIDHGSQKILADEPSTNSIVTKKIPEIIPKTILNRPDPRQREDIILPIPEID